MLARGTRVQAHLVGLWQEHLAGLPVDYYYAAAAAANSPGLDVRRNLGKSPKESRV